MKLCLGCFPLVAALVSACGSIPHIGAADPTASAPPVVYRSELVPVSSDRAEGAVSWRAANDAMRDAGGHAGHVKTEGGAAEAAPSTGGHAGHGKAETGAAPAAAPAHKH